MESGAKSKSVWYLSGHGAKDESAARQLRRETQERYELLGNISVHVYTPVGDSRESVESMGLPKSDVYTNTSIIPSYAYSLLCHDDFDKRHILAKLASISQKLDTLSGIKYKNPGERFQVNPTDEKNYWGRPQGEDRRPISGQPSRDAANDPFHFPFCLTCITMYDDATGNIHPNIDSTIQEFMLSSHCGELEDHVDFPKRTDFLKELEKERLPLGTILHPFKESATAGVFTNFADFNLFASKNSGIILGAMQKIAIDARKRLRAAANPYHEHDVWLTEKLQHVTAFYQELVTTKQSTLTKIMAICKFVSPPNTDLEILDYTCSCDFDTQPPLLQVGPGVTIDDSPPDTFGSYPPPTPPSSSQSSSQSSQSSSQSPDSTYRGNPPPWVAASAINPQDDYPTTERSRSTTPPRDHGSKGNGTGNSTGKDKRKGGSKSRKRIRKRTQKRYISRKYNHIKKHKKRYYTKKRRNI
jgi:hypothetical protein